MKQIKFSLSDSFTHSGIKSKGWELPPLTDKYLMLYCFNEILFYQTAFNANVKAHLQTGFCSFQVTIIFVWITDIRR